MNAMPLPRIYTDRAAWWPLFSHPDSYVEEAAWIMNVFTERLGRRPGTILELGSGGGNTASHFNRDIRMTLVDLQDEMLEVSRRLNPHAEHVQGDMRSVRLGKTFDAVLIHDAITYMTTEDDLVAALATARAHLEPGGVLMVLPDYVAETFEPRVKTGGRDANDGSARGLRYMEWSHAPAAGATTYEVDYAILVRDANGSTEVFHDKHLQGLFPRTTWQESFTRAGFPATTIIRIDPWHRDVFIARAGS